MKNKVSKKKGSLKITFHHLKPKNEEEAKEQLKIWDKIYNDLFDAVLVERKKKKNSDTA